MTKNHPLKQIIESRDKGVMTRIRVNQELCLISQIEPKNADEACKDDYWKQAMKKELDQIVKNETWELAPRLADKNVIGTKWVFRNKMNDHDETYAPVARIEVVRLLLAYVAQKKFKVY